MFCAQKSHRLIYIVVLAILKIDENGLCSPKSIGQFKQFHKLWPLGLREW